MKLSEIDRTLREIRVSPVKTLGQNFLHDQNLARWIVEKADLTPEDCVLEIGPGLGALTEFALASGAEVLAIEKDARLAEFLRQRFAGSRLEVVHGDALDYDVRQLFARPRVKFIGNLPYYVASQLLLKFTQYPTPISLWLLMLQKEMALRIAAAPNTAEYGALSLAIQLRYRVEYLRTVPATVFLPQPDVESAFVRLLPRDVAERMPRDAAVFTRIVRRGFSQRRKQLRNLLRDDLPDWEIAAHACGFTPTARAQELTPEQWIALADLVSERSGQSIELASDEVLAVVDEQDRVVGSAPRTEVHANNLLHRAVHVLVFSSGGDLFLQKRSRWKDRCPLLWDSSAAGHLNAGESYDAAATRELREELGVAAELQRVAKFPASEQTGQEFIWLYRATHDGPFKLPSREIEHGEFFPPELVTRWIAARPAEFAPAFVECWNEFGALARS